MMHWTLRSQAAAWALVVSLGLLAVCSTRVAAADGDNDGASTATASPTTAPAAQAAPQVSADAQPLLAQMAAAYRGLDHLSVSGTISGAFDVGGQTQNDHSKFSGQFRAPNQFRHEVSDDVLMGSTGQKLYLYVPSRNAYELTDAPSGRVNPEALPEAVSTVLMRQNPSLLLALVSDPAASLTSGATRIGKSQQTIDGVAYPALELTRPDSNMTVALHPQTHLVRRVTLDLTRTLEKRAEGQVKTATITYDYTESDPAANVTADQFAWSPPQGAADLATMPQGSDEEPAMALAGKPAPAFTLKDLEGKSVELGQLKGSVVVLDFWATWCGPCVQSLPHIAELSREQSPKGLKVFAVNQQEGEAEVKQFLSAHSELNGLTVLLDSDGAVGAKYLANAIPETVLIGKDGVIKKVFVGAGPDTPQQLHAAVESAMSQQ